MSMHLHGSKQQILATPVINKNLIMIIINCFIEPICTYSDERTRFSILKYSGIITYNKKYFAGEKKVEEDLLIHFKKLLQESFTLSPESVEFRMVENPEELSNLSVHKK